MRQKKWYDKVMIMKRNIGWILLLAIGLTGVLMPGVAAAQLEKDDLLLNIMYSNYNSLKAGEQRTVYMEVRNNGSNDLTNIRFSAESPEGWTVEFSPAVIDSLASGNVKTVNITFKVPENAAKGDYNITVIADSNGLRAVTGIYQHVESGSLFWVWVAAALAAVLIVGFVLIFLRFDREEK